MRGALGNVQKSPRNGLKAPGCAIVTKMRACLPVPEALAKQPYSPACRTLLPASSCEKGSGNGALPNRARYTGRLSATRMT